MSDPAVWIALGASLIGCYFSAVNIALKIFSRSRLAEMLGDRHQSAQLEPFLSRSFKYPLLTGMMRTWCNLVVVLAVLNVVEHQAAQWHWGTLTLYSIAFVAAGLMVAVFGVAIPLSWARYKPEAIIAWSIPLLMVLSKLLTPILAPLHLFDPIVRRISGADLVEDDEDTVSDEVMSVVEEHESEGTVDEEQREMIEAVFDLSKTLAGEIMTPRTDIKGIPLDASLNDIKGIILEAGHSRIPVYGENLDDIRGILYAKDLIQFLNPDGLGKLDLKSVLREALMIPATKPVRDLLREFKASKVHMAIVLDEYGGTAGLITIEDILEELVGDIQDEYEPEDQEPTILAGEDGSWEVDARLYIDDLNDELDLELPEDEDYETVGGFVFARLGHVPEVGESFDFQNVRLTVTAAERTKVRSVKVEKIEPSDEGNGTGK